MTRTRPAAPLVVVVGGANVDVLARSGAPAVPRTSNPGTATVGLGGVGRNVAENLARLGTRVRLVAAVGADAFGDRVVEGTAAAGVDVRGVVRLEEPTGTYTAVLDADGELLVGVADMAATDALSSRHVRDDLLDGAALLVLDGNLGTDVLARCLRLARTRGVPVLADVVSVPKARALAGALTTGAVHTVSATADELVALTGSDDPEALRLLGVTHVWHRRGAAGSSFAGPGGLVHLPAHPVPPDDVVDVTGAGDAMLAAYAHALAGGAQAVEAARFGQAAAALTVQTPHAVRPDLSDALVRSVLEVSA